MSGIDCSCCGTGGSNFAKPGDPDVSSLILSAQAGLVGITVTWTYPLVNPQGLAHTVLYRNTVNNFDSAAAIVTVGGSHYVDQSAVEIGTRYYYWIKTVSINGTVSDVIGPASAVMQPSVEAILELLTDRISSSVLNSDLREEIAVITDVSSALDTETQNRLLGEAAFDTLLAGYQAQLDTQGTLIVNESLARASENDALVASINGIYAQTTSDITAAIQTEQAARATAISAVATSVTTLQAEVDTNLASLQVIAEVVNGPAGLTSQFMVKTDVNDYVAGFGLYNDGAISDFIINVDNFAVGKPGQGNKFPFIIGDVNGVTQIALNATTLIPDGQIVNAMIGNYIQSSNYDGVNGWRIDKSGYINAQGITIRDSSGNILLSSGGLGGTIPFGSLNATNLLNSNTQWSQVGGAGKPADNADVTASNTAAGIAGQGAFATLNQITPANISTYIASAAIGSAYIGTAAIGTLNLAGQAITIAESAETTTATLLDITSGPANFSLVRAVTTSNTVSSSVVVIKGLIRYFNSDSISRNVSFTLYKDSTALYSRTLAVPPGQFTYPIMEFDVNSGSGTF